MKTTIVAKLAILLLATSTITGCLLVPLDDGGHHGNNQERSRGEHRSDHHENTDRH